MYRLTDLRAAPVDRTTAGRENTIARVTDVAHAAELEELASGLAHRLNQPLGAIAAFAQAGSRILERSRPLTDQAAAIFREITRLALEAGADVRRIRTLYALDAATPERCRIAELIREIEPMLALIALHCHGTVAFDWQDDRTDVLVDRTRIQYVVLSLVHNAFEGVDSQCESPTVRVSVEGDHSGVVVSVVGTSSSTDGGLEAHDQERFQPFLATNVRGAGLSLATSRSIVEAHQGSIGFERLTNGASRFWFRLPGASI